MPVKILVVDDDKSVIQVVERYLKANGYAVVYADNASEGLLMARESKPDLVLCDVSMPGMDGFALCRVLRRDGQMRQVPVVIMSGERIEDKDVLAGFDGGADDYVLKPFSMSVLLARLKAVLRRYETSVKMESKLRKDGVELDPGARTVKLKGKSIAMTRKEFDLLAILLAHPGRVHAVPYLLETVWGYDPADYNDPGTVEVHVSHLRKKLGPRLGKRLVNVVGHGYKFEE